MVVGWPGRRMDRPHVRHGHNLGVDPAADPAACVPQVTARTDGAGTAAVAGLLANRIGLIVVVWNGMDPARPEIRRGFSTAENKPRRKERKATCVPYRRSGTKTEK